ncbi:MAG: electron transport complex subunit RsxC [Calditrichaeota bacterium]|nr:electron transport complex subunit RsxC [Calditrichota bacterium]
MELLLQREKKTFKHGIHPDDYKHFTRHLSIERMPFVDEYVLPLSQHAGAPSRPLVKLGERVYRGQLIAEPAAFVSAALHAPVTGVVKAIEPREHPGGRMVEAIVIERDPYSPQTLVNEHPIDWESLSPAELLEMIRLGGFVGLGGAAFPTHVKYAVPEGKHARFFFVNAAECEPFLTTDYRIMLERYPDIFLGIRVILKILGSEKAFIGVEDNKWDAIELLREQLPSDLPCEVIPLETKYPQGAEKMLIEAVLHREVPSGRLPIDVEVVVNNVGTVASIGQMFKYNQPLIERVVTVTGPGIQRPANLLVPIGTRLTDVIAYCGGMKENVRQVLFGGPMMGMPQRSLEVPILKGTSGVLFLTEYEVVPRQEYPCIHCMKCVDACPMYLNPSLLGMLARVRRYDDMLEHYIMDCIECGSCSYVCPSNIPLVQRFRVAKALLREKMAREKAAKA